MKKTSLKQVRKVISGNSRPAAPAIDLLEPEVRSDVVLPVTGSPGLPGLRTRVQQAELVGVFVVEWGYDVDEDSMDSFHRWLTKNEKELAKQCPRGVAYKGTYVAAFGSVHRDDGRYRTFWAFSTLSDIQVFGEKGSESFRKLRQELLSFRDRSSRTGFSQVYQVAAGTPLY